AAHRVIAEGVPVMVAGGLDSISLVQNEHANRYRAQDTWLLAHKPEVYLPMIDTAEIVAKRYGISRERQDEFGLQSQLRNAAGHASQLSDGASACVVMNGKLAEQRGLEPLGIFRGFAVAGCEPDEMGIGPVFAVPRLLQRAGLKLGDIGLWELNEAFAVQVI